MEAKHKAVHRKKSPWVLDLAVSRNFVLLFVLAVVAVGCISGHFDEPDAQVDASDAADDDADHERPDANDGSDDPSNDGARDGECLPETCSDDGLDCGEKPDGCGGSLSCGDCVVPSQCVDGRCHLPHDDTRRGRINYVVNAHPDDELAGWSLIERYDDDYFVFIYYTRGEATGFCHPDFVGYEPEAGENPPGNDLDYQTLPCATLRIASLLAFLEAMTGDEGPLGPIPTVGYDRVGEPLPEDAPGRGCAVSSETYTIWPGRNSSIVFFDLGDGDLTDCEVEWGLSQIRALHGTAWLPDLPEWAVMATLFRNNTHGECRIYDHEDHHAVHRVVFNVDFGVPGPQYGRTCYSDPDATVFETMHQFDEAMAVGTDGYRIGHFQVIYGWLHAGPWDHEPDGAQAFWMRF